MTQEYNRLLKDDVWDKMLEFGKSNPELLFDLTGIADPTPISDGVSGVISLFKGDWLGAGLSAVSVFPYAGDAVAKVAKFARYGDEVAALAELYFKKSDELASLGRDLAKHLGLDKVAAAREAALEKVRAAMQKARKGDPDCDECRLLGRQKKSRMPNRGGTWDPADARDIGTGTFTLKQPIEANGQTITSIEFKDGFPVFDEYAARGIDGEIIAVDIPHVTGDVSADGAAALEQLRAQDLDVPDLTGYTWHHREDGKMVPVLTDVNNNIAHTGGASMTQTDLF